jgi:DNA-directed RNA polymerase subunit RPC12/RpoP
MTRTAFNIRDERACYRKLLELLHPEGLACPRCGSRHFHQVTSDYATSVPAYRCSDCKRFFDAWTGTLLQGACCPPSEVYRELLLVLDRVARRGVLKSGPTRENAGPGPLDGLLPEFFLRAKPPGAEPGVEVK